MKSSGKNKPVIHFQRIGSPLGDIIAASRDNRLCLLEFADKRKPEKILKRLSVPKGAAVEEKNDEVLSKTGLQLKLYFSGRLNKFDLRLDPRGTDFQKGVWKQLTRIPSGKTTNYGTIAGRVGNPKAARAAGTAIGSNPISIVVPCHRVIGKSGDLTGYAGGIWRKKWLLEHEGALKTGK